MSDFQQGPFAFEAGERFSVAGVPSRRWAMSYGAERLAETVLPLDATRAQIADAFSESRAAFILRRKPRTHGARKEPAIEARLVRSTGSVGREGETLDSFSVGAPIPGISAGLIDDRHETWLVVGAQNCPMRAEEFERLKAAHEAARGAQCAPPVSAAPPRAWIADLLPDEVLATDPGEWRAPTSWELRHVVGEGSFTGVTGAAAAALVGVTPQNFRKYTASDGASTRQSISYAMWHLLLHRLGVQWIQGAS